MQAKKPTTRAKHDKVRQNHIEIINALYRHAETLKKCSDEWVGVMVKIDKLERQLQIYDKEMNYED